VNCRLDETGRIVVADPELLCPLDSETGRQTLQLFVRETGKLPRITERRGRQFVTIVWSGTTIPIDDLLGWWDQ
jgi:hypothetical protein